MPRRRSPNLFKRKRGSLKGLFPLLACVAVLTVLASPVFWAVAIGIAAIVVVLNLIKAFWSGFKSKSPSVCAICGSPVTGKAWSITIEGTEHTPVCTSCKNGFAAKMRKRKLEALTEGRL